MANTDNGQRTVVTSPDPTQNVIALVVSGLLRQDDLRAAESRRVDQAMESERRHSQELATMRGEFYAQLAVAEAKRIDAIRAVDVAAVAVANDRATAQATVLANQVETSAETLRALVAATATSTAQQFSTLTTQLTERLSALEKVQNERSGGSGGMRDMWGWIVSAIVAIVAVGVFIVPHLK